MEKLSKLKGKFEYLGKPMPDEFAEVCKIDRVQLGIKKRKEHPWRYSIEINKFLKYEYGGDLPKSLLDVARKLRKPEYICDLFYDGLGEEGYKNLHPKEYADFFENKPHQEQVKIFVSSDYGARTLLEYEQDVKAASLSEDMVAYHTKGILTPNENATGRANDSLTTSCDFIFRNPEKDGKKSIEQPIELKTKWGKTFKDNEVVQMRGTIDTILKEKGMILAVYVKMNKAVLIDPIGKHYVMTPGKMKNGKDCVDIHIDKNDIVDFTFWKFEDVKMMMNMIWDQNQSRETK